MKPLLQALAYAADARNRFVAELEELIRFPTISSQPGHAGDLVDCASWLVDHLRGIGLEQVALLRTPGHPLVYAEWCHAPECPTVLVYGHYDVQPVDPLAEWRSPPFEPTLRGQDLFGRGTSDDKGQLFVHIKAIESYLRSLGRLPVNVRCLLDGEEEIGSPHLVDLLRDNRGWIDADVALVSDTRFRAKGQPAITYALRGALNLELEVRGRQRDLHSGVYGGAVPNPLQALSEILAGLHSIDRRVAIPGFYDAVRPLSERERVDLAASGPTDAQMLRDAGVARGWGECGYSLYERTTIRPAVTITGITGGYQDEGSKAVIPSCAKAKLDLRLVPDQEPRDIDRLFRQHLARVTPPTVLAAVRTVLAARPVVVDRKHPALRAAAIAFRKSFGSVPVLLRLGGSIPAVGTLEGILGISSVLMGFGLPDDGIHAPNEKFHLPNFDRGIAASIWFLAEVARQGARQ